MDDRQQFIEKEFKYYYDNIRDVSSPIYEQFYGFSNEIDKETLAFAKFWTHEYVQRMYNILCVYFESLDLKDYLFEFKTKYKSIIEDENESTKMITIPLKYGDTEDDLFILNEWKRLLAPFNFFWTDKDDKEKRKLTEFLESTNEILKITKTKVYKEDSINNIIRETAKFYFNGIISYSEGYFVHQFKGYKPDIIIKELNTAIEYKLIRENKEIAIKLDELLIDAKRYTGNHNNKFCIAVFCLSTAVNKTKKEIKEDWKNMNFPVNWELIVISDVEIVRK
ncbi:hypothetical protein FE904_06975 [Chryseobacterium indologenes]|uniref:hypothetical protein n=1 Tax=Chryseobacterium indologenes TaxID=253 RepID=UPI001109FA70|nr:hypothetical protein [Chryseobacterium indologenes]TLX26589.1 hypothetical protein FE904_06975 [Chryseobacterium indologenes]